MACQRLTNFQRQIPDFNSQFEKVVASKSPGNIEIDRPASFANTVKVCESNQSITPMADEVNHGKNELTTLSTIGKKLDEVISRLIVFERHFINGQMSQTIANIEETKPNREEIETNQFFMISNGLPIKNLDDLTQFEKKLKNPEFMKASVCILD